ncbi:hypothetical protein AN960_09115 [Bacillus sp. FJAT-25509]|uniref:hypothetical protein n=1 Tax=Bacillaceae TaxID=186817 RepID=UPI0006F1E615|nr:hypothetical protein [Bacillus sp. FJAT-25509]KQL40105.1 hypothetical protein AN960_09115 [Bacillus sp. FJAT-25509]
MRKYEKEFMSINCFKDINFKNVEECIRAKNFNIIEKVALSDGVIFILEKFSINLGCKLVTTIMIYGKDKILVKIVTAGGKIKEFLDLGSFKNTHNEVVDIVEGFLSQVNFKVNKQKNLIN